MADWSKCEDVTPNVKRICLEVKKKEQGLAGYAVFTPQYYRILITGKDKTYLVKVMTGVDQYIHMMIRVLPNDNHILQGLLYPKSVSDPLVPF